LRSVNGAPIRAYGSDPLAYDFEAAFSAAGTKRVSHERSSLPSIIGLFDGNRCRRCDAVFPLLDASCVDLSTRSYADILVMWDEGASYAKIAEKTGVPEQDVRLVLAKVEHREWHEGQDELRAASSYSRKDELAYYANLRPLAGYKPDGKVVPLEPITKRRLDAHEKNFAPPSSAKAAARAAHKKACEEVAALFGLSGDSLKVMVLDLRRQGYSVDDIAKETGMGEGDVKSVLAA
jgi:hypothetical protein